MEREKFYQTKAWKSVRKNIWIKQSCLCARCHKPVYVDGLSNKNIPKDKRTKGIVHHKVYLTDDNFADISISLNEELLEGLCIDCHNNEHFKLEVVRRDVAFDSEGNLISRYPPTQGNIGLN